MNTIIPEHCPDWCDKHETLSAPSAQRAVSFHRGNLLVEHLPFAGQGAAPLVHLYAEVSRKTGEVLKRFGVVGDGYPTNYETYTYPARRNDQHNAHCDRCRNRCCACFVLLTPRSRQGRQEERARSGHAAGCLRGLDARAHSLPNVAGPPDVACSASSTAKNQ